ncbi:MAG: TetR/AcrR family transcriptional regulator [Maribacter dokdonensis]|uniref:Transcriptional regulator, TetR family n=2 Tax=Maribacter dokdonensis TaxID=320912 RepID=A0A1H4R7L8_9FLAO|nr:MULTISPECIES: TetR/AcrR family transcriptional regulator [Maribacter]APA65703.1 TetR family transcriptional regulator [Maribacter sp. 1_2014MBL_MicDiv]MDF4223105.1 TetR/AcrR family transcriptional regulator [Maribacter huludaoensis]SEC27816.1 transcriptional regulator, TetR family [Maribacter dokdonensis]|tara:strand:- start:73 stop:675 length:603 start_codon:yes stop_codon:yes gene_type:complete
MKQALKSELSKQLILNEAFKLFYEEGFKTTSIDKIMKATTMTKGAFYHHYANKKELGIEVITQKLQRRVQKRMVYPLYQNGNAYAILEDTFLNSLKSFSMYEKKHGCPTNNLINEIGDYENVYQKALKNIIEEWKRALVELIDRGKSENTIKKDISSAAAAIYLISAFEGIRGIRKLYDDDEVINEYLNGLSMYLNQIKQ